MKCYEIIVYIIVNIPKVKWLCMQVRSVHVILECVDLNRIMIMRLNNSTRNVNLYMYMINDWIGYTHDRIG